MKSKSLDAVLEENLKKFKQNGLLKDVKLEQVSLRPFSPQFPTAHGLHSLLPQESGLLLALYYSKSPAALLNPRPSTQKKDDSSQEEYLGNPLEFRKLVECSHQPDHPLGTQEVWSPLPANISRVLLSRLAPHCSVPLWLLADSKSSLVATYGQTRLTLTDSGVVGAQSTSLDSLREELLSHFPQSPKIVEECCCSYRLDRLRLECSWSGAKSLLDFPQHHRGSARLVMDSTSMENPLLSSLYQELCLLQSLELAVKEGTPVVWPSTDKKALQRVMAAMEELGKFTSASPGTQHESLASCLEQVLLGHQWEMDFTDLLWNLLKECSSNEDLILCLFTVMKSIHYGDVRPLVSSSNKTYLGQWVHRLVTQGDHQLLATTLECPSPAKALELVLEVGMLKVQRHLASIYSGLELASQHMLDPYFSQGSLSALIRAAHILELAVCCLKLLGLSHDTVTQLTRQHISAWTTKMPELPFSVEIPIASIRSKLKDLLPEEWSIRFRGVDSTGYTRELVYLLSKTYFWKCLGLQYPLMSSDSTLNQYYSLTAHCIHDPALPVPLVS